MNNEKTLLIMDNFRAHMDIEIEALFNECSTVVLFLPSNTT
jgi:hypothetical protein